MIEQENVIAFFNECAGSWDAGMVRSDAKIERILDNTGVTAGSRVLDVACGTGVLIGDYLRRNVRSVTAVDIAPEMLRIAREKYPQENVRFVCGDAATADLGGDFDAIVVYNAFPHFPDPDALIAHLASLLAFGGRLTVAHGSSRAAIDAHHHGAASRVSNGLMEADALAAIFAKYLHVTTVLSTDEMYQVVGEKPKEE